MLDDGHAPSFAAIPTRYAGVNFRSRLEARWAAFFDLAGWQWVYEPLDCNGWLPDFSIAARCDDVPGGVLLVEVKATREEAHRAKAKIDRANQAHRVLVLSAGPFRAAEWSGEFDDYFVDDPDFAIAGLVRDGAFSEAGLTWDYAIFRPSSLGVGVRCMSGWWADLITGEYTGNDPAEFPCPLAFQHWREAGNRVQWQSK
ncbi:hypothetical protein AWB67_00971 [Caballeronia terrestris]|uniref:Uncharacterized protein n=1 Tax=Caballeronia terrestris TaxID=1226301 RepID=A0A158FZY7_9BURK|nr:hypothetical protein [Caballeronia terrestris]SAL24929.1 hypothetical protein AWB67_00971 [Caballeronia terrestris]